MLNQVVVKKEPTDSEILVSGPVSYVNKIKKVLCTVDVTDKDNDEVVQSKIVPVDEFNQEVKKVKLSKTDTNVSIGFKKELLEKYLASIKIDPESFYEALRQTNQIILTKSLEKVAMEILNCKMDAPAADFFFKAKANEWISIVIDTYLNRKKYKIEIDDDKALEDVARFLEDHFATNVKQGSLEKISKMSGTKLKNLFKEKYGQSITEFTQRKRMNVAETLLLNTGLPIKEIAESVGYTSASKFSIYYKRYKGKLPSEVRNSVCNHHEIKCDHCE